MSDSYPEMTPSLEMKEMVMMQDIRLFQLNEEIKRLKSALTEIAENHGLPFIGRSAAALSDFARLTLENK